jgi:hypothetical protein
MSEPVNSTEMLRSLRAKVVALLRIESKMGLAERGAQQWQLLVQLNGDECYVVGKGGVNTMFYTVNGGERKLCYPDEMLALIDCWVAASMVPAYAVTNLKGGIAKRCTSRKSALEFRAKLGYHIVKIVGGKQTRIYVRRASLFGKSWEPVSNEQ